MLNKIHEIADDAGERLKEIILELEENPTLPLPRPVRMALYAAGAALAKLNTATLKEALTGRHFVPLPGRIQQSADEARGRAHPFRVKPSERFKRRRMGRCQRLIRWQAGNID